jgi:hypothetical protein
MADESDVENALVTLVAHALYPNGTDAASVPGPDCKIYRGWPNSSALDADLAAGTINVTIFAAHERHPKITTRYSPVWLSQAAVPSLTVSVSGNTATFGGTADLGQLAGLLIDGLPFAYRTQPGDTPASVAANLAVMARANFTVALTEADVSVANIGSLTARVVADATAQQEIRRQEQLIRITCWCPTAAARDASASAIDLALAQSWFITFADGTSGRLTYAGTLVFDQSEDALLYRRDLLYRVEYATVMTALQPAMLFGDLILNAATFAS